MIADLRICCQSRMKESGTVSSSNLVAIESAKLFYDCKIEDTLLKAQNQGYSLLEVNCMFISLRLFPNTRMPKVDRLQSHSTLLTLNSRQTRSYASLFSGLMICIAMFVLSLVLMRLSLMHLTNRMIIIVRYSTLCILQRKRL